MSTVTEQPAGDTPEAERGAAEAENVAEAERLAETAEAAPELDDAAPSYPRAWMWDTELADGVYVKADRAPTRDYGEKTVIILQVCGEERSIWLLNDALFNQVRQEISRRPGRKLTPGERVVVQRLGERESVAGRKYMDFRVHFPDRPDPTPEQLWGDDIAGKADTAGDEPVADGDKPGGDIPF
jgi:hypothetical protein